MKLSHPSSLKTVNRLSITTVVGIDYSSSGLCLVRSSASEFAQQAYAPQPRTGTPAIPQTLPVRVRSRYY